MQEKNVHFVKPSTCYFLTRALDLKMEEPLCKAVKDNFCFSEYGSSKRLKEICKVGTCVVLGSTDCPY